MTVRFTPISRRTIAGSIAAFCAALALGGNALANTWPPTSRSSTPRLWKQRLGKAPLQSDISFARI